MNPNNSFGNEGQGGQGGGQPQFGPSQPAQPENPNQSYNMPGYNQDPQGYSGQSTQGYQQYGQPSAPQMSGPQPGYGVQASPSLTSAMPTGAKIPTGGASPSKLWLILAVSFMAGSVLLAALAIWAFVNYTDQKNNVDSITADAVAVAVKEQADKDALDFNEKEKQPNRQFAGPEDYGRVSFDYPKTWSVYEAQDASAQGSSYQAYFSPGLVPAIAGAGGASGAKYALRLSIENKSYEQAIARYDSLIKKGDLKSSSIVVDEQSGVRLEGYFNKSLRGMAVIFKLRDKTVTLQSDAETFRSDFDALIKTLTFNK